MNAQLKEHPWVSNGPTKVYQSIAAITGEMAKVGIAKGRKNNQQGYSFRGIDDVYSALSGLLAAHKLCVIPRVQSRTVTERETKNGGVLFYAIVDVEFDLVHADDGSRHTARIVGEAMDSGDKATNKAMSAAYKYFALQTFCIPTEGDNDADAHTHEVKGRIEPRGDLGTAQSSEVYSDWAAKMLKILRDHSEPDSMEAERKALLSCLDLHDTLRVQGDLYVGASNLLSAAQRSGWKKLVDMAKKLEATETR